MTTKNDPGDLDSDYTPIQHLQAKLKTEDQLAKKQVRKMAKDSQGTVYTLFSDNYTVNVQSWITRNNTTSAYNEKVHISTLEIPVQQAILNSPLKQYATSATPIIIKCPQDIDVNGVTYNVSNAQLRTIRGILDTAIRVSGN